MSEGKHNHDPRADTRAILRRLSQQEGGALEELLHRVWPRLEVWIRSIRGPVIRSAFETVDCAQDVALGLVQSLPKVAPDDPEVFDRLLFRMVQNSLRNKADYLAVRVGEQRIEEAPAGESSVRFDVADSGQVNPSMEAWRQECREWIQRSLDTLSPEDREVVLLRACDNQDYATIGDNLGLNEAAARMRYVRAMLKLGRLLKE